ncbi:hypothetical protein EV401DRAFT_660585 [Pisolithus croceorrhizus]|nr:hypothetical protein EV401DRAFT_660585 [Pisolithus croceorrhizus]
MAIPGGFGCSLITGLISAMLYGITVLQGNLCVLHDALLRGSPNREISRCCHMHFGYPTRLVHVSYVVLLPGNQLRRSDESGVHCLVRMLTLSKVLPVDEAGRSYAASGVAQLLVVVMVQLFFAHKIYRLCRRGVRWLVTAPILLFILAHYGFGMVVTVLMYFNLAIRLFAEILTSVCRCYDNKMSAFTQTSYYSVTPSAVAVVMAEVLITVSLCVILYDGGSYSECARAKRLIKTLITYAANRCLLTS